MCRKLALLLTCSHTLSPKTTEFKWDSCPTSTAAVDSRRGAYHFHRCTYAHTCVFVYVYVCVHWCTCTCVHAHMFVYFTVLSLASVFVIALCQWFSFSLANQKYIFKKGGWEPVWVGVLYICTGMNITASNTWAVAASIAILLGQRFQVNHWMRVLCIIPWVCTILESPRMFMCVCKFTPFYCHGIARATPREA